MERRMDRPTETIFDTLTTAERVDCITDKDTPHVQGFLEDSVNTPFVTKLCENQQILTIHRIAHWLRANSNIFQVEWETGIARELNHLADDLDYLGDMKTELESS